MRQIGNIQGSTEAQRFADYLLTQGITTKLEQHPTGVGVWVREEEHVDRARDELRQFELTPTDPRYAIAAREADRVRAEQERRDTTYRKNLVQVGQRWNNAQGTRPTPLSYWLIGVSVLIAVLTDLGKSDEVLSYLLISSPIADHLAEGHFQLHDVAAGEVWRLLTPIFVHFGIAHLLFNMLWIRDLGKMLESRMGSVRFGLLVLLIALTSNLAQDAAKGPYFGGMSGVVYGLFGYAWMKERFDPMFGVRLGPNTVLLMIAWFFICTFGLVGPIANWAHGVGLVAGVVAGLGSIWLPRLLKR